MYLQQIVAGKTVGLELTQLLSSPRDQQIYFPINPVTYPHTVTPQTLQNFQFTTTICHQQHLKKPK